MIENEAAPFRRGWVVGDLSDLAEAKPSPCYDTTFVGVVRGGVFNGVTEWLDHRKTRQNENQRLSSSWFGETARVKGRAYAVAMDKSAVWN